MPCTSEYLDSTPEEIWLSRVYLLLDEINTGQPPDPHSGNWMGYDPRSYGRRHSQSAKDDLVATLCYALSRVDVSKFSLEMQMWWRDHQIADKKRKETEEDKIRKAELLKSAKSKLTDEEKAVLGIR